MNTDTQPYLNIDELVGQRMKDHRNKSIKFMVDGAAFTLGFYWNPFVYPKRNFHWEICLWNEGGHRTINGYIVKTENEDQIIYESIIKSVKEDCAKSLQGFQICCGCNSTIKKTDVAGTYFAGSYCTTCWEGKYKAIEARETYN